MQMDVWLVLPIIVAINVIALSWIRRMQVFD
jgi:hypothetical protein